MEFLRETLDHTVQQILLRHWVFTLSDKFQHFWKNVLLVNFDIDSIQTADSHQVLTYKHFQIILFLLSFGLVPARANSHPKIRGFSQVGMDYLNRILYASCLWLILASCIWKSVLAHLQEIVSEEKSSDWILDGFHHLKDVLQNSIWSFIVTLDVYATDCDQEIQSWNDIRCVLDCLI